MTGAILKILKMLIGLVLSFIEAYLREYLFGDKSFMYIFIRREPQLKVWELFHMIFIQVDIKHHMGKLTFQ